MLFGIVAVIAAVLIDNGGIGEAIRNLSLIPSEYPDSIGQAGAFSSFFGAQPMYLLIVVLLTSLGTWGLPQMVGKFYSIKNEDAIKKGTVISTVFAVIVAGGCYFIGGFGRLYADELAPIFSASGGVVYDAIIPAMIGKLPGVIVTVVLVLVLAASMSTLSSLVLTSSATLTLDVIVPLRKKGMSEKGRLLTMRLFIVFFIAVSAAIAIVKDAFPTFTFIAQMMGVSWGALAGAFLAPFLYGLYWKKTTPAAVGAAFVFGVGLEAAQLVLMFTGVTLPENIIGFVFKNPLYSGVVAMLGGLVIVPIVSLFSQKQLRGKEEQVEDAFSCYEEKRLTSATDSLGN
jgi:SSS family solute:Na+ symporter